MNSPTSHKDTPKSQEWPNWSHPAKPSHHSLMPELGFPRQIWKPVHSLHSSFVFSAAGYPDLVFPNQREDALFAHLWISDIKMILIYLTILIRGGFLIFLAIIVIWISERFRQFYFFTKRSTLLLEKSRKINFLHSFFIEQNAKLLPFLLMPVD